ncbi:MAG: hypothetical protein ACK56F_18335, partial [bacterium]
MGLGCTDWLLRPPGPLRAALPGVLDTPLAGVRGRLRAPECGVPGIGGESVGLTTPGELNMRARARARTPASRRQRGGECALRSMPIACRVYMWCINAVCICTYE